VGPTGGFGQAIAFAAAQDQLDGRGKLGQMAYGDVHALDILARAEHGADDLPALHEATTAALTQAYGAVGADEATFGTPDRRLCQLHAHMAGQAKTTGVGQALSVAGGGRESAVRAAEPSVIQTTYWYPFGCRDCEDFLWNTIPELEWTSGSTINVAERDTRDPADFEALLTELERRDVRLRSVPVMIVGDAIFQGYDEIESGLRSVAEGGIAAQSDSNRGPVSWEPGAIALAGLLDGVNPCAFSAMVFLVSALAVAGRTRRVLMAIGLSYSLGVFATYFLIGAGLLGGLRNLVVQSDLRRILETALAMMLLILAGLSVIDGVKLSRGRTDLLLKLPDSLSKRVHGIIRRSIRSGAAVGGSLLLGALVALIELGCTGQVYLPTIAWMISRGEEGRPWLWLLIYNSAFIIPLLAVFVISYRGVSAIRLAGAFKKRGAAVKYATAGLFAVLAAVVFVA